MSNEQKKIQELEEQIRGLHSVQWAQIEAMKASTSLIVSLSQYRKSHTEKNSTDEYISLLERSRATLITCQSLLEEKSILVNHLGTLLDDLTLSIDGWFKRRME